MEACKRYTTRASICEVRSEIATALGLLEEMLGASMDGSVALAVPRVRCRNNGVAAWRTFDVRLT
jgi:hypothetical protein